MPVDKDCSKRGWSLFLRGSRRLPNELALLREGNSANAALTSSDRVSSAAMSFRVSINVSSALDESLALFTIELYETSAYFCHCMFIVIKNLPTEDRSFSHFSSILSCSSNIASGTGCRPSSISLSNALPEVNTGP